MGDVRGGAVHGSPSRSPHLSPTRVTSLDRRHDNPHDADRERCDRFPGPDRTPRRRAWQHLVEARDRHPSVVPDVCAPVLYFGDLAAYRTSPLRVLTVGLNPSDREFPEQAPWNRSPGAAAGLSYLSSLDAYFHHESAPWVVLLVARRPARSPGLLLGPRPQHPSCTPTCAPWSPRCRRRPGCDAGPRDLMTRGVPLRHDLVAELRPHVPHQRRSATWNGSPSRRWTAGGPCTRCSGRTRTSWRLGPSHCRTGARTRSPRVPPASRTPGARH